MASRFFMAALGMWVVGLAGCTSAPVIDPAKLIDPTLAAFEMTHTSIEVGAWVTFEAQSSAIGFSRPERFVWAFGDGDTAQGPTAMHRYHKAGTYTVTLTTYNVQEMKAQVEKSIEVTAPVVLQPRFPYTFGAGIRGVGDEIQSGLYRTRSGGSGCFWERLLGIEGDINQVIAQHSNDGPAIVEISSGDRAFRSEGCARWTKDTSPITNDILASFSDGVYFVGDDIAPGVWQSSFSNRCSWQRLSGFSWQEADVIDRGMTPNSTATVHIQAGDTGFASSDCGTWTRLEE